MEPETPPTPQDAARAARAAAEEIETACIAEIRAALERHGCRIIIAPVPVGDGGDLWTYRWGVRLQLND